MRTGKSHCVRYYNKLGPFTKLATSYAYCLGDFHMLPTPNTQKAWSLAQSIVRTSPNLALMPVTATYGDFAAGDTSVGLGP